MSNISISLLFDSFRYIPNPAQVLGEVLASGKEMPEEVEGEILAGDAVELNVLTMEKWGFFLDSTLPDQFLYQTS